MEMPPGISNSYDAGTSRSIQMVEKSPMENDVVRICSIHFLVLINDFEIWM